MSGALFAVEFVLKSSRLGLDRLSTSTVFVSTSVAAGVVGFLRAQGQALGIAGAGTHLVGRIPYFSIQPNLLIDVLQFSALGLGGCAKGNGGGGGEGGCGWGCTGRGGEEARRLGGQAMMAEGSGWQKEYCTGARRR